ncbi:phage tail tape measure protein [Pseudomonas lactis]|uniref:Phage tail tape measure protein n=1 Tax=Pseudomonas lactis TaxID=1615674 RepID=A0A7Y1M814_9PSED|nr:phage tail tape measure protein [Pseudomonas lactis]KRP70146.1 tail protein [Pseudomonas lactis]NNA76963.1 phage tail tape measure protein [Pseudomonas lactis]NNA83059.1 phage tail tape measure protein [Pseudomonas lactis]
MSTIAELGIAVNSGEAVKATSDLENLAQAGAKAEKAADGVSAGFDKAAAATADLSASERKLSETLDEAKARLLATAKASLESSEYYQRLTTSVNTNASAMESSGSSVSSLAALQRRLQAESDALVGSTDRQAEATRGAAAATGVQAEGLQALLAKINPTVAAYEKLDQQQELLKQHLKAGNIDSDQFKAYSADIEKTRSKLGDFDEGLRKTGVSAGQTQAALRQLPAQFTDIFTSLAGGQNPLMVLIQQGGQIKDSFGGIGPTMDALKDKFRSLFSGGAGAAVLGESLAGIASGAKDTAENAGEASESLSDLAESSNTAAEAAENAKKAYGALPPAVTSASLSIMGMVAAVAAAAAVVGVLIYGYNKGSQEADEYNKALILTGNYAGTSAGQLSDMSRQVAATVGTTGQAADVLATLAGTGKLASGSFVEIAEAALSMEKATGKSIDATVAEFVKIADDPVAAAKSLNEQYHFLTASTYAQIVSLKEQGNEIGATKLLTDTYADTVQTRSRQVIENLNLWERAWLGIKNAASGALSGISEAGRTKSFDDQIKELRATLTGSEAFDVGGVRMNAKEVSPKVRAETEAQIRFLELQRDADNQRIKFLDDRGKAEQAAIVAGEKVDSLTKSAWTNEQKRTNELKEYKKQLDDIRAVAPNDPRLAQAVIDKNTANINDKYKDPKAASTQVDLTSFNNAKNNLSDIVNEYRNAQKELEAQQKAGVVSLSDYAKQRSALINQEKDDVTAAYQAEIDALEAAKAKKGTTAAQSIQIDQKIADARQGMVKAQKDADSQLTVIATNEKGRLEQLTAASEAYVNQLERQRAALEAAGSRAANGLGLGDREAGLQASLDATTDKFNDERAKLLDRRKTAPDKYSQEDYMRDLASLEDAERKYRATVVDNYDQMSEAQGNWRSGASSAFQNYLQSANDVAGQTKILFTNAFSGMEDAVANFAVTGKLSFSDFTRSILADMARIATRQAASGLLSSLAGSALGAYFGGGAAAGAGAGSFGSSIGSALVEGRASGGPVDPNTLYEVNEKGPELFNQGGRSYLMTGAQGGSVTPLMTGGSSIMAAAGGGGGNTYNFPVSVSVQTTGDGGAATQEDTTQLGKGIQQAAKTEAETAIAKGLQPGGSIWRVINGR